MGAVTPKIFAKHWSSAVLPDATINHRGEVARQFDTLWLRPNDRKPDTAMNSMRNKLPRVEV